MPKKSEPVSWFELHLPSIGEILRIFREEQRYSLRDIEDAIGISASQIQRIEAGKSDYSVSHFFYYCCELGLLPGEVMEYATDFATDRLAFLGEDPPPELIEVSESHNLTIGVVVDVVFSCFHLSTRMLWSTDPLGRAVGIQYPTPRMRDTFHSFAAAVRESSPSERKALIHSLCVNSFRKLESLGLLPINDEWLVAANPRWVPQYPKPAFLYLHPKSKIAEDPIPKVHERKKTRLTNVRYTGIKEPVRWTLQDLIAALKCRTQERGKKAELARFVGVSMPRVSEWLNGEHEPGATATLKLLEWVSQTPGPKTKTPSGARNTEREKQQTRRKTKQ